MPETEKRPPTAESVLACATWDEELQTWSDAFMPRSGDRGPGPVVCEASHLSVFGLIWREAKLAVLCSNLNVFTARSLKLFGRGVWLSHVAGMFWILLIVI